ncbi:hypothetical protein [Burkholderia ubonensis]|uniref:hypothetical protein n=1 Tax=Burkholderia ubonensis TaxID=101571 RepID=UPI0007561750|nr:hypothetical protein [Burkholderia ubonensis]KVO15207.1 hypothetical protein WJ74_11185 [Burkholderia ubonensis]KVT01202.1 hypothetical protein WK47_25345 [Burkholderia ubonensis]KVT07367.1 hypothetical protein WK46_10565 [Burkholderia ubonensis]KVT33857.1 hypothetical protein WK50_02720 [Burkholderia ubonensis]
MSKLSAIQERIGGSKGDLPATENFALQVAGYTKDSKDRDAIIGTRLDTGEEVTVVLRPYKSDKPLKAPRAEVKDFVAKEGEISTLMNALPSEEMRKSVLKGMKAKTEPGGTIIVQRAFTESETGVVNAGWLQSAAKYPEHCQVVSDVLLRIDPVGYAERDGRQVGYANATALMPSASKQVTSAEQLKAALQDAFAGVGGIKGRPIALVRLSDGEVSKAVEFALPVKKNKETGEYKHAAPAEAVEAFLASQSGKQVAQLVGDPDLSIEVVPGQRVSLGTQAKASFEKSAAGLEQVNRAYRFTKAEQGQTGFAQSYMVLHAVEGGQIFSSAEPLSNKPSLFHPRDVPTPFFNGKPTAIAENKEITQHTDAAVVPASVADDADEEEPFEIDDVVQNAIPAEAMAASAPRMRV